MRARLGIAQGRAHPRQAEFLKLTCEEALYGGAAGGGKTEALMMWLAEGVSIPSYSGLFLRRTFPQLSRSNDSPIMRSIALYKPLGGVYTDGDHRWTFPSGAIIEFGHMQHETSVIEYQGPSFHRVTFDELTQFSENQYTFLFSRIRKAAVFPITLGIRAASNPGGVGHEWVAKRFITREARALFKKLSYREQSPAGTVFWPTKDRAYVPARVADNPAIDTDDYIDRMLKHLPARLREQMVAGDWDVVEGSLIQPGWFQRYGCDKNTIWKIKDKSRSWVRDDRGLRRFMTVDTAGTSKDKIDSRRGKNASWSVAAVWDYDRATDALFLRHMWRDQVGWLDLKTEILGVADWWKPKKICIENAHFGPTLRDEIGVRYPVKMLPTVISGMLDHGNRGAKLERAIAVKLFDRLERGGVFLPDPVECHGSQDWCEAFESEATTWDGDPEGVADQIDTMSYACYEVNQLRSSWGGVL